MAAASVTYFCLRNNIQALEYDHSGRGCSMIIPAESWLFTTESVESHPERSRFITAKWRDKTVQMFFLDLLEQGERV